MLEASIITVLCVAFYWATVLLTGVDKSLRLARPKDFDVYTGPITPRERFFHLIGSGGVGAVSIALDLVGAPDGMSLWVPFLLALVTCSAIASAFRRKTPARRRSPEDEAVTEATDQRIDRSASND